MNKLILIAFSIMVIGSAVQVNQSLNQLATAMFQLNNVANAQTK